MRPRTVLLVFLTGCARIAPPPGGPPDRLAPALLSTRPDSMETIPDFKGDVEFRFDEVVSEGGQPNFGLGSGDLEKLVVLSPSNEVPVVRWHRDRITVHPREGWLDSTVYRVELLAGVRDLRSNASRSATVVTFTTGAPLPTDTLHGRVVDWTNSLPARNALVEAVLMPDSLVYRTQADSSGRFKFGPLPRGEYLVYGVIDQNRNARRESRELFDSVRVAAGRDSAGELWAFKHDSTPPRIQNVARSDSVTATIAFTGQLDPIQRLPADSATVLLLPDSTAVEVEAILPQSTFDSLFKPKPVRDTAKVPPADTVRPTRPRPDTARIPGVPRRVVGARPQADTTERGPLTTKPRLFDRLMLRVKQPWRDSARYAVIVNGLRTVNGITGQAKSALIITPPLPAAKADSGKLVPVDTSKVRPDSLRRDTTVTGGNRLRRSSTLRLSSTRP